MDVIPFEKLIIPECRSSYIVMIDGCIDPLLSNTTALIPYCEWSLKNDRVEICACDEMPSHLSLQIISMIQTKHSSSQRIQLLMKKRSTLNVVTTLFGHGAASWEMDAQLEEGAILHIGQDIELFSDANLSCHLRVSLQKDAVIDHFSYLTDRKKSQARCEQNLHVILNESGSCADMKGLDRLQGSSSSATKIRIEHRAPHCTSKQRFKKILDEESHSSIDGVAHIQKDAKKSDAIQQFHHLLLSDKAHATAKPYMEILNDDVAASHAATFSQPNPEDLFYFHSRGIPSAEAKKLLLMGFIRELIEEIKIPMLRQHLFKKGWV